MNTNKWDQLLDRYILYHTAGNVYWKDRNGVYRGCNYNMANLFKLSAPEDIVGKTDFDFFLDEFHVRKIMENDQLVITSGEEISVEEIGADDTGKLLCFYTKKIPLYDKNKNIVGVMGTSIDITAQKEAEAREINAIKKTIEQQKETEALREKVKTMQMLGGTIAHEIRNPLLAIGSARDALEKYFPILLKTYSYAVEKEPSLELIRPDILKNLPCTLQVIKDEIESSNLFIDTLLSKIKEKPDTNNFGKCSISECVEIALHRYPFGSEENRSIVHWKKDDDFIFIGNKTMMIHVLFNLLKNAIHYIGEAGKGDITLWTDQDEKFNYFHFKDTGTGISQDVLPYLFTRFFSQTRYGTGLGLA